MFYLSFVYYLCYSNNQLNLKIMEKVIRDGKVAVLISPGYGAGWYTWHEKKELLFHPKLIELVEQNRKSEITEELCQELLGLSESDYVCVGGAEDLKIIWLPIGTSFLIQDYDGSESIIFKEDVSLIA